MQTKTKPTKPATHRLAFACCPTLTGPALHEALCLALHEGNFAALRRIARQQTVADIALKAAK